MSTIPDLAARTIDRLKAEVARLRDEQEVAMKKTSYLGMSSIEAKEFDERSQQIYRLYEALLVLMAASAN